MVSVVNTYFEENILKTRIRNNRKNVNLKGNKAFQVSTALGISKTQIYKKNLSPTRVEDKF